MHKLLERQLKKSRIIDHTSILPSQFEMLLKLVSKAYEDIDQYRYMIERTLEVSSQELDEAYQKIQREQEKIQAVMTDAFLFIDNKGMIITSNPEACRLLKASSKDLIGKGLLDLVDIYPSVIEDETLTQKNLIEMMYENKVYHTDEARFLLRDNTKIHVEFGLNPFYETQECTGSIIIFRDIQDRITLSENIKKAQLEAERLNSLKSLFIANMSHEMRTPLNGIIGIVELLKCKVTDPDSQALVETIDHSSEDLLALINDVLDLSKLEKGTLNIVTEDFDLSHLLKHINTTTEYLLHDKDLSYKVIVDENLPYRFHGDEKRIKQLLLNLIGNAAKFTYNGSITLTISTISRNSTHSEIKFTVKDTGIGIPTDKLNSIFDSFTQVNPSSTRNAGGCGLGLAITKSICELMNGKIFCTSTLGQGTEIGFILPLAHPERKDESLTLCKSQDLRVFPKPLNAKVLLVEDNKINQQVGKRLLEILSCEVDIASDGKIALEKSSARQYDIILMDCQMPHYDGYQVTELIRTNRDSPNYKSLIIALTAHAYQTEKERCFAAGMDDFLSKPYRLEDLHSVLSKCREIKH